MMEHRGLSSTSTFFLYLNTWQLSKSRCKRHVPKRVTPLFFVVEVVLLLMDTCRGLIMLILEELSRVLLLVASALRL